MNIEETIGKFGVIFYDGSCGACSHFVGRKQKLLSAWGFSSVALQEEWVKDATGVSSEILLTDMHLLANDGKLYRGADAYRYVFKKVWWLTPLYVLTSLPLLRSVFDGLYRVVADRRRQISKVCGLRSKARF